MDIAATRIMAEVLNNLSPEINDRNIICIVSVLWPKGTEMCVSGPLIIMPGVQITGAQILVTTPVFSCSLDFSPNL